MSTQVYDSQSDAYLQLNLLERSLIDQAKGYIICALDYDVIYEQLRAIRQSNTPLVLMSGADVERYGAVVLSSENDNYAMGFTTGQYAGEIISDQFTGEADVLILDFPDLSVIVERANGLEEGVLSNAPNANIIERYLGATRENGYQSVKTLIEAGTKFDMIVSINDAGSYGAIDALVEADISPDEVLIFSIDAERQATDYIHDDYFIRGSLSVGRQESALASVNVITQLLAGEAVPETIIILSGEMVTKATLESNTAE